MPDLSGTSSPIIDSDYSIFPGSCHARPEAEPLEVHKKADANASAFADL